MQCMARKLDLVSLFVEVAVPRLIGELQLSQKRLFESSMNGPTPDVPIQDIFALYRRTTTLAGMFTAFCTEYVFILMFVLSCFHTMQRFSKFRHHHVL